MDDSERQIRDEATRWHLRLRDGGPADWEAFVRWLEPAAARSQAYDEIALIDRDLDVHMLPPVAANDGAPAAPRRLRWALLPAAAVAAAAVAMVLIPGGRTTRYAMVTAPGEKKLVALADGGSVTMNGGTRLILDRADPRSAGLEAGEALFTIRHDAAHPFQLDAGGPVIRDLGTVFNVRRDGPSLAVEVIDGRIVYDPGGAAVALAAGQTLRRGRDGAIVTARADPARMAGWEKGHLSYSSAPLAEVAGELSRTLGTEVAIDPALARTPFTGSIRIDPDQRVTVDALAAALGLAARRTPRGWTIEPHSRASR